MADHPINVVLEQEMADQPDLTYIATAQDASWEAKYGTNRVVRMPIAENAMVGMGVGMAMTGRRAIVDLGRAAFLFTAMDPIVNQASKWRFLSGGRYRVPLMVMAITRHGENSGPQHEHVPHAMLSQVPGLVVAVPSSANAAAGLMATALRHDGPVVLLQSSRIYFPGWDTAAQTEDSFDPIPFGVAKVVRAGSDVSLIGIGNTVIDCLDAAEMLNEHGVSARVIDLRTAAPLDRVGVARMVQGTGGAVLVDETVGACSLVRDLGFHLLSSGAFAAGRVRVLESRDFPVPASPTLQTAVLPTLASIVEAAMEVSA